MNIASLRGTCRRCRRKFQVTNQGILRRHHSPSKWIVKGGPLDKCWLEDQIPAEIVKALIVIAKAGNHEKTKGQ